MFGVNKGAVNNAKLQISELGVFIPTLLSGSMVKKAYSENFNLPCSFCSKIKASLGKLGYQHILENQR